MKNIKPINIMNQVGLSELEKKAALAGLDELLAIAGVKGAISIRDLGVWRNRSYLIGNNLAAYQSVDWYISQGISKRQNQLDAAPILDALTFEPWRQNENHYDLMLMHWDIFTPDTRFIVGLARPGTGTVISTARFRGLDSRSQHECVKTEVNT